MGVYLREKKLDKGYVSFYLDIYHNKTRWYEFLEIRINKKHPTEQDKEKKRLATEIRAKRESELIVQDNALLDRNKRKADFVKWFETYIKAKCKNSTHNSTTLVHLKEYMGKRPLQFTAITPAWLKGFTAYLLSYKGSGIELFAQLLSLDSTKTQLEFRRLKQIVPDVLLVGKTGFRFAIEIFVTSDIKDDKAKKIEAFQLPTLRIDLSTFYKKNPQRCRIDKTFIESHLTDLFNDPGIQTWVAFSKLETIPEGIGIINTVTTEQNKSADQPSNNSGCFVVLLIGIGFIIALLI